MKAAVVKWAAIAAFASTSVFAQGLTTIVGEVRAGAIESSVGDYSFMTKSTVAAAIFSACHMGDVCKVDGVIRGDQVIAVAEARKIPAQSKLDVPVMAGGGPDFDACPSTGTIVGLDPNGDGFLSVRSGPGGSKYREIDRVYNGMHVYICEQKGPWFGVVYSPDNRTECNVSSGWTRRLPYTGPCKFGWIHSKYVGDLAG